MAGESGPVSISFPVALTIAGLFGVACYNAIEILILVFYIFGRRSGLYFWSMLVATAGIATYAIASFLRLFALAPNFLISVVLCVGWWGMVTGQSVVLYSRLHLVLYDKRKVRWVLRMIIANICLLHIPVTIVFLACNLDPERFLHTFNIYERIQLAGFSLQEAIISGIYVWEASHSLEPIFAVKGPKERSIIRQLIFINILVILLDISLLITEYTGHFHIQTSYQPLVYGIKLKMEFIILNKLIALIQQPRDNWQSSIRQSEPNSSHPTADGTLRSSHAEKRKSLVIGLERDPDRTPSIANIGGNRLSAGPAEPRQPPDVHYGVTNRKLSLVWTSPAKAEGQG